MNRRTFLGGCGVVPLVSGCRFDRHFDLSWEEEVQLHDGRIVVVRRTHTYERIGHGPFTTLQRVFSPYAGLILRRDTTMTFDAGGKDGVVSQLFKGFAPMFLGQFEGIWYAVLYGDYYYKSRDIPGQDWGVLEGPFGQWAIKLEKGRWQPMSMSRLPAIFQQPNMFMLYGHVSEHALFSGKRITLADKEKWLQKHPYGYSDIVLARPSETSPRRPDSTLNFTSGDIK